MKTLFSKTLPWASAAAACFALAGCMTEPSSSTTSVATDGGNVVLAQEVQNMAGVITLGTLAKVGRGGPEVEDSVDHESVVSRLAWDSTCGCFVRSADFTNRKHDFGRTRTDSIWLYAGGQAIVDSFVPKQADSIIHVRHVTRIDGQSGRSLDFTARTLLVKKTTDSGTVYVWTGTVTGTLNGVAVSGSTFSLTRSFTTGSGFGVPQGFLFIKRGPRDVSLVLHKDGTADCTIRRGDKVERTTHIDGDGNES